MGLKTTSNKQGIISDILLKYILIIIIHRDIPLSIYNIRLISYINYIKSHWSFGCRSPSRPQSSDLTLLVSTSRHFLLSSFLKGYRSTAFLFKPSPLYSKT